MLNVDPTNADVIIAASRDACPALADSAQALNSWSSTSA